MRLTKPLLVQQILPRELYPLRPRCWYLQRMKASFTANFHAEWHCFGQADLIELAIQNNQNKCTVTCAFPPPADDRKYGTRIQLPPGNDRTCTAVPPPDTIENLALRKN